MLVTTLVVPLPVRATMARQAVVAVVLVAPALLALEAHTMAVTAVLALNGTAPTVLVVVVVVRLLAAAGVLLAVLVACMAAVVVAVLLVAERQVPLEALGLRASSS